MSFAGFRDFARREICDLCGAQIAAVHDHLFEPAEGKLRCACEPCAIRFDGRDQRFLRVRPRFERLHGFRLDDAAWERLGIPIRLAYFVRGAASVTAFFPSAAGGGETVVPAEDWRALVNDNPLLSQLLPEVEALLVHRIGERRAHYLVSIDACHRLVCLVRRLWRGLNGGDAMWRAVDGFIEELDHPPL